ncbi:MAG: phosphotransferase [Vagococcus fluvialis]
MNTNRKLIGSGAVSRIYVEDDIAYKTYPTEYPLDWVAYEVNIQQEIIEHTNLRIPKMELLKDAKEIRMDFIDGYTLAERIRKEKYKLFLEDFVDIQLSIYEYSDLKLENAHEIFKKQIKESKLGEEFKIIGLSALEKIEKKNILCHLDIHFLNIMYAHSEYYIIDWINAKLGNPVLDIARTYVVLKQYAQRQANKYLKMIVQKGDFKITDIESAIRVMAILRLLEEDAENFKKKLLEMIYTK